MIRTKKVITVSWLLIPAACSVNAQPRTPNGVTDSQCSVENKIIVRSSCGSRWGHEPVFPGRGEVRLDGTLRSADVNASRLEMNVSFVTLADGKTAQLEPYRHKTVLIGPGTSTPGSGDSAAPLDLSLLHKGDLVMAIGKDLGVGHSLPVRLIRVTPAGTATDDPSSDGSSASGSGTHRLPMIWICGDSLSEAPGKLLVRMIEQSGKAHAALEYKVSSGLSVPSFYNWPEHFERGIARWNPDLVVVILGANDAQGIERGRQSFESGTRAWQGEYARRVGSAMETLGGQNRKVIWLSVPVMRSTRFTHRLAVINKLIWEEAAIHRGATYLDSSPVFAGRSGAFLNTTPDGSRMRASDGIHFARAGASRLARFLLAHINQISPPNAG